MEKRSLQIDVCIENINVVVCRLSIDGSDYPFMIADETYRRMMVDGVFIRDGKEKDSANVLNTTHSFEEQL